jgi:polysaccharide biosynthesis protein PelG
MAGIGFQLRKLSRQETISSVVAAAGHAAVIAAGPWLFTIFALASITALTEEIAGRATVATFRIVVIYAFGVSLVLTAPVTIVATRRVADALWLKRPQDIPPLLFGAFMWALLMSGAGVALLCLLFNPPAPVALAFGALSLLVALIWVSLCFCGAVRDYTGVTLSFLIGLATALVCTVAAAARDLGPVGMIAGFLLGMTLTFLGLTVRILRTFPQSVTNPWAGVIELWRGAGLYWHLAAGALFGTAGVWVDKWVFWVSSVGERVDAGFIHAPLYDSAMFISSLVIIPSLAAFVMKLETDFFDRYQHYYATIKTHGTIGQIEASRARLAKYTLDNLTLVTAAQAGICAVLILSAPAIVEFLNLQFRQIAILRFGALGAVFQFIFIASTSMLLFFDRRRLYLALQVLFFTLNLVLTEITITLNEDYYGVGYFAACFISSLIAFALADRTFANLNFLTFIGNNPTIRQSTAPKIRRWRLGWLTFKLPERRS